jgi:hypothetical protein
MDWMTPANVMASGQRRDRPSWQLALPALEWSDMAYE